MPALDAALSGIVTHATPASPESRAMAALNPASAAFSVTPSDNKADLVDSSDVALRIARAVHDGTPTMSVELHPAELGRIEVRLSFRDSGVGVQMTLDRPDTYAAFNRDRASLEQQLLQAGVDLSGGGLDLRYGQQSHQPPPQPGTTVFRGTVGAGTAPREPETQANVASNSLVDIIV